MVALGHEGAMVIPRPRVSGLPLHPLLVHFPVTFWLLLPVLDFLTLTAGPAPWWTLGIAASSLGTAFGSAAIAAGLIEYVQPSLAGIDLKLAARHGIRTSLAWCLFAARMALAAILPVSTLAAAAALALDLAGCTLLIQGVYYGTKQVYQRLEEE